MAFEDFAISVNNWANKVGFPLQPMIQNVVRYADVKGETVDGGLSSASIYVQCGLTLSVEGGPTLEFPLDPVMGVSGKNIIVRRQVAKGGTLRGTIKESWREDDFSISIAGVLRSDERQSLPEYMKILLEICRSGKTVKVDCDYLRDCYNITSLVVEGYDFPHTKGLNSQAYALKCYSDDSYVLLEQI